jgi:hypothetical protein
MMGAFRLEAQRQWSDHAGIKTHGIGRSDFEVPMVQTSAKKADAKVLA